MRYCNFPERESGKGIAPCAPRGFAPLNSTILQVFKETKPFKRAVVGKQTDILVNKMFLTFSVIWIEE